MLHLKRLFLFYCINVVITLTHSAYYRVGIIDLIKEPSFWIVHLIFVLIAHIIGFAIFSFKKSNNIGNTYLYSQIFVSSCFIFFILYTNYSDWQHEKKYGNIETNQDYFKYYEGDDKYEKKIAFDTLITKFSNPNEIKITGSLCSNKDTIVNGDNRLLYFITLFYKKNNSKTNYKAAFTMLKPNAKILYYDKPFDEADRKKIDSIYQNMKKDVENNLNNIPDSTRRAIEKEVPKELIDSLFVHYTPKP